jgi:hypothetical protein
VTGLTDALSFLGKKHDTARSGSLAYINLIPDYLRLLEFVRSNWILKKFFKPPKCLLITSIGFSTCYKSVSARLSSRENERARCYCIVHGSRVNHSCNLGVSAPWVFVARRQVFDSSAWCGAGTTVLFRGRRDPSFVGNSIVKTASRWLGDLAWALVAEPLWQINGSPERDLVTGKQYSLWVLQQRGLEMV